MALSVQEFSAKIKAKYPEYRNVDDKTLADAIVKKYPEYRGKVRLEERTTTIPAAQYQMMHGMLPQSEQEALEPKLKEGLQQAAKQEEEMKIKAENAMNPFGGVGVGVAKGALNTVKGAAELGVKGLEAVTGVKAQIDEGVNQQIDEAIAPKGLEQNIGFIGEQVAEFALPMSKIGKAGKAAEAAAKAGGAGKVLSTGAKLGTEAVLAGGAAGATEAMQEGEISKNTLETAAISAAIPFVAEGLGAVKNLIKNGKVKAARNEIAKLIKPDKNAYTFGKDPALAVAQEGIVANSWDDLVKKISTVKNDAGKAVETIVSTADDAKTVSVSDLLKNNLDDFAKKNADTATQKTYIQKIQDLVNKTVPDVASGEVKIVGQVPVENMNAKELWEFQKKIGKLTKWTNQVGENEANKQLHKLYRAIGDRLDELAPGTKEAQLRYANFLGAEKAATARAAVATRNTNALMTGVGALAGGSAAAASGNPQDWVRNTLIGAALPALIRSPLWKTRIAKVLAKESGQSTKAVNSVVKALVKYGTSSLDTNTKPLMEQ